MTQETEALGLCQLCEQEKLDWEADREWNEDWDAEWDGGEILDASETITVTHYGDDTEDIDVCELCADAIKEGQRYAKEDRMALEACREAQEKWERASEHPPLNEWHEWPTS